MCRRIIALVLAIILIILHLSLLLSIEVRGNEEASKYTISSFTKETTPTGETTPTEEPPKKVESIQETEPTIKDPIYVKDNWTTPTEEEHIEIEYKVWESLMCDTSSELEMLACVIFQEAGSDNSCDMCRYRVADVVLNRIESDKFPNTMYDVLTAHRQYGRFYWTGIRWADRALSPNEREAVERAYQIAKDVLEGNHSELYGEGYVWQAEFIQGTSYFKCCGHYFGRG